MFRITRNQRCQTNRTADHSTQTNNHPSPTRDRQCRKSQNHIVTETPLPVSRDEPTNTDNEHDELSFAPVSPTDLQDTPIRSSLPRQDPRHYHLRPTSTSPPPEPSEPHQADTDHPHRTRKSYFFHQRLPFCSTSRSQRWTPFLSTPEKKRVHRQQSNSTSKGQGRP